MFWFYCHAELHSKIAYAFLTNSLTHLFCIVFFLFIHIIYLYIFGEYSYSFGRGNPASLSLYIYIYIQRRLFKNITQGKGIYEPQVLTQTLEV